MFAASFLLFVAGVPLAFAAPYSQAEASQPHDVVYVDPIRSSSGSSTSTTAQSPVTGVFVEAATTKLSTTVNKQETTNVAAAEGSDDTVKAQFSASTTWDFAMVDAIPTDLHVSTDHIKADSDSPMSHTFETSNVAIEDGFLVLNVPGDQAGKSDLSSAEVVTTFDMMYGSVRTWAILTEEPGVCNGIFFYEGDDQETDIEWISDPSSQSNKFANNGTRALQYTNQALDGIREHASGVFGMAPDDATSAVHEYRLDWFEDRTEFFLDSVFQHSITTNVPNVQGPWVWNNWGDGNPGWTADPPVNDAPFKIQKIEMYYNPA